MDKYNIEEPATEARFAYLARHFGIERPSGELWRDLEQHRRVALQRGYHVQHVKRVAEESDGRPVFEFIASSSGIKRDGNEVLNESRSWILEPFLKNPRWTWCHQYETFPVGTVVDVKPEGMGRNAVLRSFHRAARHEFAQIAAQLYLDGDLNAVSIGWTSHEYEKLLDPETGRQIGWLFTRNELLEIAAVVIPADPNAVLQKIKRGIIPEKFVEMFDASGYLRHLAQNDVYVLDHRDPVEPKKEKAMDKVDHARAWGEVVQGIEDAKRAVQQTQVRGAVSDALDVAIDRVTGALVTAGDPLSELRWSAYSVYYQESEGAIPNASSIANVLRQANRLEAALESALSAVQDVREAVAPEAESLSIDVTPGAPEAETSSLKRKGAKASKQRRELLKKCDACMDEAKSHLRTVLDEVEDAEETQKAQHDPDDPPTPDDAPGDEPERDADDEELRALAEALGRKLDGEPEDSELEALAADVARLLPQPKAPKSSDLLSELLGDLSKLC